MISLCLSGGGFRAALFHLGALRRLNEVGLLSRVTTFSSVSGGSVVNGVLASRWRALVADGDGVFTNFAREIEATLCAFCARDIRSGPLVWDRLAPWNWPKLALRRETATNRLAERYDPLFRKQRIGELRALAAERGVRFIINASSLQTGVNFEFGPERVGDYRIGYTDGLEIRIADAVAASSAFPLAFPPFVLRGGPFAGGDLRDPAAREAIRAKLLLTDGGVYDNLGLEPVWRKRGSTVLCSDGGKPFAVDAKPSSLWPRRLVRAQEVIRNQSFALRMRMLIGRYESRDPEGHLEGAYWGIGTDIDHYPYPGVEKEPGYRGGALERIRRVRTDFDAFSEHEQRVLRNHGWALARIALRTHMPSEPAPPGEPPDPALLGSGDVLR